MIDLTINMIVLNEDTIIRTTLENIKSVGNELVIVDGGSTDTTVNICQEYTDKVYYRRFDGNFSAQKNFANFKSSGRWIFNIDADEQMSDLLKSNLDSIMKLNQGMDLIRVPRINKVEGITKEQADLWGYTIDEDGDISWPDWQARLYKRSPEQIKWVNPVHERLEGYKTYANLSTDKTLGLYLLHYKTIERQTKQNNFYNLYRYGIPSDVFKE